MRITNYSDISMRQGTRGGYDLTRICKFKRFYGYIRNSAVLHKLNDRTIFSLMTKRFTDLNLKMYFLS